MKKEKKLLQEKLTEESSIQTRLSGDEEICIEYSKLIIDTNELDSWLV